MYIIKNYHICKKKCLKKDNIRKRLKDIQRKDYLSFIYCGPTLCNTLLETPIINSRKKGYINEFPHLTKRNISTSKRNKNLKLWYLN